MGYNANGISRLNAAGAIHLESKRHKAKTPPKRLTKYTDEQVKQVKQLSKWYGKSHKAIARELNVPHDWVSRVLDEIIRANVTIGEKPRS